MIDPITALAAIQSAVKLVKKVSQTVDDVGSLGPVLGKYFDAKTNAVQAVKDAKDSGKASNMGTAIQIEMALEQSKQFESELQMLFMQAGKVDVWNNIKARAGQMDKADKFAEQAARDRAKAKKEEMDEVLTILAVCLLVVALSVFGYFVYSEVQDAKAAAHPVHHRKS
jgi:hypothetical protein